ncbi:MAG: hypothetical protein RIC35_05440 [Marinoscillum sp.]
MTFYHSLSWTAPAFVHLSTAFKSLVLFLLSAIWVLMDQIRAIMWGITFNRSDMAKEEVKFKLFKPFFSTETGVLSHARTLIMHYPCFIHTLSMLHPCFIYALFWVSDCAQAFFV